jgi:O-methyltransferase
MFSRTARNALRPWIPQRVRAGRRWALQKADEWPMAALRFGDLGGLGFRARSALVRRLIGVNRQVLCAHTHAEMAEIVSAILDFPADRPGCIVEAGCFKGGSTVKLSIAAKAAGRRLVVFDSFEGLPEHDEKHGRTLFGEETEFLGGRYAGSLDEVTGNVRRFGEIDVCEFNKGWFEDTMPHFRSAVAVAFLDVDLASSTRTCLENLYPLLVPGGRIFSHDGHLPLCMEVFRDRSLWEEIGATAPVIRGLGSRKLISIAKPDDATARPAPSAEMLRPRVASGAKSN